MLYSLRLLLILINIDQETVLNWFGVETATKFSTTAESLDKYNLHKANIESKLSPALSVETLKLIIISLWQQVQDGLTLTDIENIIFFLVFLRFIILIFRYNVKTSIYITCIGLCAGYLWYRHLIDVILMYRQMLVKVPYFQRLGASAIELESSSQAILTTDLKLGSEIHWYNPGKLLYYAFIKGIIQTDSETGLKYYIDPISMILSNLNETRKAQILPTYYKIYNIIIPRFFQTISEFWNQLSGIAAYAIITRIGKRYCPYLIRWHWTFLLIIGFVEQILIYFLYRLMYFQEVVIQEKLSIAAENNYFDPNLLLQFNLSTGLLTFCITLHLGAIFFGLLHAIWGQYFYFPFLVENTELHIGPRPKNSIYSGGQTAWQDEKQKNVPGQLPKLWYGWFGSGTSDIWIFSSFKQVLVNNIKKLFRK
mmetsp:Transcript_27527/g.45518  ORF Transcript_27527/g.45518 Transcript_27527/m.45518 type:complete len:424 (+) Transcript_27527:85-1356(+)